MIDHNDTIARLSPWVAKARAFSGWDTSAARILEHGPPEPWSYEDEVRRCAVDARTALDLGTGGGERLADLRPALPSRVIATEEWHINAPVARARLAPLGVDVVRCDSLRLPFADGCVDLVLSRHEALDPAEVVRVLAPGGVVVTQQIEADAWPELRRFFPRMTTFGDHFTAYRDGFRAGGLEITTAQRHARRQTFATLGDLVFMLLIAPWTIPEFDPLGQDLDALLALEAELGTAGGITLSEGRYLLVARSPTRR